MKLKKENIKFNFLQALIPLITTGYSGIAYAACSFSPGTMEQRYNFTLPNITVQRDAPAGTVLAEQRLPQRSATYTVGCTSYSYYYLGEFRFNTLSAYGNRVYNTNVSGVGIRISSYPYNTDTPYHHPISSSLSPPATIWIGSSMRVQLVKTLPDAVGTGTISAGTVSRNYIGSPRLYFTTVTINSIIVNRAACTVKTTSIPVPLGRKVSADFAGPGSTTTDETFNIPLSCTAGTKVNITLDGTPHPSGAAGVLALSPSATGKVATGVGVQVLYKNTPVTFGNKISTGTAPSGDYTIPLVGRYYQTDAKVTGGEANATATFTMTYN
ncbi:TPA: fimbrial protein [Enterobacter cloacae]